MLQNTGFKYINSLAGFMLVLATGAAHLPSVANPQRVFRIEKNMNSVLQFNTGNDERNNSRVNKNQKCDVELTKNTKPERSNLLGDTNNHASKHLKETLIDSKSILSIYKNGQPLIIGKGSSGTIYLCYHNNFNKYVAAKYFHEYIPYSMIMDEIKIAEKLNGTNIFPLFYGIIQHHGTLTRGYLMEFIGDSAMTVTTLKDILEHTDMYELKLNKLLVRIAEQLYQLHQLDFIHGDLHPHNIVINIYNSNTFYVRFIDFGQVAMESYSYKYFVNTKYREIMKSNYPHIAPELFDGEEFSKASDIYSLGYLNKVISTVNGVDFYNLTALCMIDNVLQRPKIEDILKILIQKDLL